jgi:hypothetical protein
MKIKIENQEYTLDIDKARQCGALNKNRFNELNVGDVFKTLSIFFGTRPLVVLKYHQNDESSYFFGGFNNSLEPYTNGIIGSKKRLLDYLNEFPIDQLEYIGNINGLIQQTIEKHNQLKYVGNISESIQNSK